MTVGFFHAPWFGWCFYGILIILLAVAAVIDTRTRKVPKAISLTALSLGFLANLIRGLFLGLEGKNTWAFGDAGMFVGALDGLFFATVGFLVAFGIFFLFWIFGIGGGGDVKIVAAVGAWVGARDVFWILIVAFVVVSFILATRLVWSITMQGLERTKQTIRPGNASAPARSIDRLVIFSLPLAIAVGLVFLFIHQQDLGLALPLP